MQQPWYATREQVKRALDIAETARNNAQVDRAIAAASRSIEAQMHRRFYPWDGTRYFGFRPWNDGTSSWRLWLAEDDLVSVSHPDCWWHHDLGFGLLPGAGQRRAAVHLTRDRPVVQRGTAGWPDLAALYCHYWDFWLLG